MNARDGFHAMINALKGMILHMINTCSIKARNARVVRKRLAILQDDGIHKSQANLIICMVDRNRETVHRFTNNKDHTSQAAFA